MIEVSRFRLANDVTAEAFLEKDAEFQQLFIYQQEGLVRRTVASGLDGEWLALTWWRSMKDVRQSTSAALSSPIALEYASLLDAASLSTDYFRELPG
jgi:hypothetical protein